MRFVSALLTLLLTSTTYALADEIRGKQITFSVPYSRVTVRVLKDGHVLITGTNDDCKSPSGQIGGEAMIGQPFHTEFSCVRRGHTETWRLDSTASFDGNVLNINESWASDSPGTARPYTQHESITISGNTCTGS